MVKRASYSAQAFALMRIKIDDSGYSKRALGISIRKAAPIFWKPPFDTAEIVAS
jgi:hypothetical protein